MNNLFKIVLGAGLALALTSCGTANDAYGNNYPTNGTNNGTVYRANDGQIYRRGEVYKDRNGNVYQNGRIIRTNNGNQNVRYSNQYRKNLPPGQAKKMYGGSAKDYAKGQQKKKYNQWKNDDYKDKNHKKHNNKKYKKK